MKKILLIFLLFLTIALNNQIIFASLTYLNYTISNSELEEGYTEYLGASDQFLFTIDGEDCRLMATSVYSDLIEFTDCKNSVMLGINNDFYSDTVKLDVTLDDYYDYSVKLNGVVDRRASLTVKKINEKIPEGAESYYFCAKFYRCPNGERVPYSQMKGSGCISESNPFSLCQEASERESCLKYYDCSSGSRITECKPVGRSGSPDYGCECLENPEDNCPQDTCTKYYTCPDGSEVKECELVRSCTNSESTNDDGSGASGGGGGCGVKCECVGNPESLCSTPKAQKNESNLEVQKEISNQNQKRCLNDSTGLECPNGTDIELIKDDNGCIQNHRCNKQLSNGRNAEVKIMPAVASQQAIERLGDLNFTVELKEEGEGNYARPVYEITGNKQGRFLGIFKIQSRISATVDAETGELISTKKPWWAFLVAGV